MPTKILSLLRSCVHCSMMFSQKELLCEHCWAQTYFLQNTFENLRQWNYKVPTFSLFTWREQKRISSLIYGLKEGAAEGAIRHLASQFINKKYHGESKNYESYAFIPAPPKVTGAHDHAYLWAKFLSELCGSNLVCALERGKGSPQKGLKRSDRFDIKMNTFSHLEGSSENKVIFLDDVITTGATANAAYKALKSPKCFEIWTISCRSSRLLL